jgi:hypothetical protein
MQWRHTPGSYEYLITGKYFTDDEGNNLAPGIFAERYTTMFKMLQALLKNYGLDTFCSVNPRLLQDAVMDYFADIARIKDFHPIIHVQRNKIYAYEAYWLLRNNVIQLDGDEEIPDEFLHINEVIISHLFVWLLAKQVHESFSADIQIDNLKDKLENSDFMSGWRDKLEYDFLFRPYTAQTLLLTFDTFITATGFTLSVT